MFERVGVAVGCFDEPDGALPSRSVYEIRKHAWVDTSAIAQRFPRSRP